MVAINLCKQFRAFGSTWMGVFISGAIASTWLMSLMGALSWNLAKSSGIAIALWLLLRTFLHTGLFVIAHDAMHGNIIPNYPVINGWIGQLALGLYGFLPYRTCRKLHWQHHRYPAQEQDPDFCSPSDGHLIGYFVRWYCCFIRSYLTFQTLVLVSISIVITTLSLVFFSQVSIPNLILFWVVPWVLSSIQLFAFGIFLPHYADDKSTPHHRTRSYYYPVLWSLLTCYHFGYHREHHAYPDVPWYQLPYLQPLGM